MQYRNLLAKVKLTFSNKIYNHLLVVITNYNCTLRCTNCGNLNPYMEGKRLFDFKEVSDDINKLSSYMRFSIVQLQGGEPLLHPYLDKFIENSYKSKISSKIEISTNATLCLSDEMIAACNKYNVTIRLSDYGLKRQITAKLIKQCELNNIKWYFNEMGSGNYKWYFLGLPGKSRNDNDEDVQRIYRTCPYNICWTLSDGLLTKCSRSPIGHLAGLHEYFPQDLVNIRDNSLNLKTSLKNYFSNPSFMQCCRFCNGGTGKETPAGVQMQNSGME